MTIRWPDTGAWPKSFSEEDTLFPPLHTERLIIRLPEPGDIEPLHARRNHPEVAELQDWELPYPMEKAERLVESVIAAGEPTNDEWFMAIVTMKDGQTVGDLALHLTWEGRTAEVGYTLERERWGKGYAVEAVARLVDYLFDDLGVTRVFGMLDPENLASARVLERTGFLYEGRTRLSYWKEDVASDDLIYGMLLGDRDRWVGRKTDPPTELAFIEVTVDNFEDVAVLQTHESQKRFVAPMLWSFSDALFPEVVDGAPVVPWMRAIEADGELAGFVMVALVTEYHPEPFLWRLLIDRLHQRRGIGARAIEMLVAQCRDWGAGSLLTSWEEGTGSPRPFYEGLGFVPTGRIVDAETEARLRFE